MTPLTRNAQIMNELGRRVVDGYWRPGACIDPEALVEEMGVSRTLLREVMRVVEDKGLIKATPGVGTRVRPVSAWDVLDVDVARWIRESPEHPELKHYAKELVFVLAACAPDLQNPYLTRALAVLGQPTADSEA